MTRNRPESLARTLRSLRSESVQPWEVIVSDDSDEPQAAEVARIAQTFGCRYVRGPQQGLYANRNHAAACCLGTHIRTMDDDHEFPPHHFQECLHALKDDPASIWIIGEYYPTSPERSTPPICPGQLDPRGFSIAPADSQNSWALADGAAIYPRAIFDRGLRYVQSFKFGDVYLEFGSRLHWLGYRLRQLRNTYVLHHLDAAARSFHNPDEELAARFFAMMCHSFRYQPTLTNRLLSSLEFCRQCLQKGGLAWRALRRARREYREHMRSFVRPSA
ncbi:MAG TPA: glycosyltransferase family 2 protein [Chthoniobacterales bacterium]|nr:glycosyltransferase family 2 protein [Chthoniobacterales bacterium]